MSSMPMLPTATMQLNIDYYDPDKGDRRYSSKIMSPVDVNIDVPSSLPNRKEILKLLDLSKNEGVPIEVEFTTGTDRYKNTLFTIYSAKQLKPVQSSSISK